MLKVIRKCFEKQKVVSFYFDKEDNQVHLTGYIYNYNEDEILIAHITPRGEYDGFILRKVDDLYRIDYDGDYERKIQCLYKIKKQAHPIIPCNKNAILYSLLEFANNNDLLLSLELKNDKVTGLVKKYDNYIQLKVFNDNGIKDGECVINIDDVFVFSCDTDYEQDLKILNTV